MASITFTFSVRDNAATPPGTRKTGLTPTWVFLKKLSDNSDVSQPSIAEISQGQYKFAYDAETNGDAAGQVDAGSGLANPSDRYIDFALARDSSRIVTNLDTTVGSRGTSTYAGGPVASVTGAVGSVTGAVGSVTGDVGGRLLGGGSSSFIGRGAEVDVTYWDDVLITTTVPAAASATAAPGAAMALTTGERTTLAGVVAATPAALVDATALGRAPTIGEAVALAAADAVGTLVINSDGTGTLYHLDGTSVARTFTAAELDPGAVQLAADGLDLVKVEGTINARQALCQVFAACTGEISGVGTGTLVIKAGGGSGTTRLVETIDSSGNRATVVQTLPP